MNLRPATNADSEQIKSAACFFRHQGSRCGLCVSCRAINQQRSSFTGQSEKLERITQRKSNDCGVA